MKIQKNFFHFILYFLLIANLICMAALLYKQLNVDSNLNKKFSIISEASAQNPTDNIRRTRTVEVAEQVSASIVCVGATVTGYVKAVNPAFDDFFYPFMSPYQVYQYKERMPFLGSGVIIDSNGYIITNYHVVEGKKEVFITLMDGREITGNVLDADRVLDIALIKIDANKLPAAKLGDSDSCLIGETVLAIGNPFGNLIEDPRPTVTSGVISALHRNFNYDQENDRVYQDMIQTDAAINPGNSGGALVNLLGEVVGINTFIMSRSGASHGIGFAIPINRAKSVVNEIMKYGRIRTLWLDFEFTNLTRDVTKLLGFNSLEGAIITNLQKDGPAFKAGMAPGDIITKANNTVIKNRDTLRNYFITRQVGDKLVFEIFRKGKTVSIEYVVQEFKQ